MNAAPSLSLRGAPGLQFSRLSHWYTSGIAKSVLNLYCLRAHRTPTPTHRPNPSRRFLSQRILYCTCHVRICEPVLHLYCTDSQRCCRRFKADAVKHFQLFLRSGVFRRSHRPAEASCLYFNWRTRFDVASSPGPSQDSGCQRASGHRRPWSRAASPPVHTMPPPESEHGAARVRSEPEDTRGYALSWDPCMPKRATAAVSPQCLVHVMVPTQAGPLHG